MRHVRALATLGRAAREDAGVRVRQPLGHMVCVVPPGERGSEISPELIALLRGELNVKEVRLATSADSLVSLEAKPNFRSLGRKFGKATPLAVEAVKSIGPDALREFERGGVISISVEGEEKSLDPEDLTIVRKASGDLVVKEEGGYFAAIDPEVTPALRREGIAREFVSRVQRMRKESGFAVSDRITLRVKGGDDTEEALRDRQSWIASEVLAVDFHIGGDEEGYHAARIVDLDGDSVRVDLARAG